MTASAVGRVELGRADVAGPADLVAGLVVEGVGLLGDRLDDRQRLAVEDRDGELAAVDVALDQDAVVVAERGDERGGDLVGGAGEADAERRALARPA